MEQSERLIWKDSKRKAKVRKLEADLGFVSVCSCWTSYGAQSTEYDRVCCTYVVVVLRMYSVDSQGQIEPIFHVLAKKKQKRSKWSSTFDLFKFYCSPYFVQ